MAAVSGRGASRASAALLSDLSDGAGAEGVGGFAAAGSEVGSDASPVAASGAKRPAVTADSRHVAKDAIGEAHARLAARLSRMLAKQVRALEKEPDEGFREERVKALLLLAKALQAMDEAVAKAEAKAGNADDGRSNDGGADDGEDILEFRRRLERQMLALDAQGPGGEVHREP